MKRKPILALCTLAFAVAIVSPVVIQACHYGWFWPQYHMDPLVSARWLNFNLWRRNLVILDIRYVAVEGVIPSQPYDDGHIPGSIWSHPYIHWVANPPDPAFFPWLELPSDEYLFDALGNHGITKDTWVVVVGTTSGPFPYGLYNNADPTRVAMTLIYAGVKEVAILDGGIEAWMNAGYPLTTDVPVVTPVTYDGHVRENMFVSSDYVESKIGKATIVDARDTVVYNGEMTEPWLPGDWGIPGEPSSRPGHIPTARNLPTPDLWNVVWDETGTFVVSASYKDKGELSDLARDIVGSKWYYWWCRREIIVYCGVGGYASTMFFVLSEVLGYRNVKVYDGSYQLWDYEGRTVEI